MTDIGAAKYTVEVVVKPDLLKDNLRGKLAKLLFRISCFIGKCDLELTAVPKRKK